MRTRLSAITLALVALVVACGIPDNGQVSRIQDKDLRQLGDTIPTTTTTTSTTPPTTIEPATSTTAVDEPTTVATEEVTLYFISGGQLKGYPRDLARPATANQVLTALREGPPSGDPGVGLRTALPPLRQALIKVGPDDGSGVATIELPPGFFDQIPPDDQLLAIGQIVLTITEVGGIGQVLFTQNGTPRGVPRRSGGLSGNEPLAHRDYEELLNPPVTSTTPVTSETTTTVV